MPNQDSLSHTVKVVIVVSLVCSIVASLAAVGLRPFQENNKTDDIIQNILAVSGLDLTVDSRENIFNNFIEERLVNLVTGTLVPVGQMDINSYDPLKAAKNTNTSIKLSDAQDIASIGRRANFAKIYLVKDEKAQLTRIIFPIYGLGLWSMMYAFIAINADGNTIDGIIYYEQGETPGLGSKITRPDWLALWQKKRLFNDQGKIALRIVKGKAKDSLHEIDGITASSFTVKGVQNSIDFWFGDTGFGPFLNKIQAGEL